jgi:hypothetical protein
VKILGTDQFYWDAGSIVMVSPSDATKLIKIGQYRTGDYGIAVSVDNGMTWTTIIDFDGLHGGGGGQTIIYQDMITKASEAPANPDLNDLWVDTLNLRLKLWDGTEWVNIGYEPETPEEPTDPDTPTDPADPENPTDPTDPDNPGDEGGEGSGDDSGFESGGNESGESGGEDTPGEGEEGGSS